MQWTVLSDKMSTFALRWDKSIEEIENLMLILSCGDLEKVKMEIKARI